MSLDESPAVHTATSKDGTQIVASVQGQGPPLVLLHAGLGDAELDWRMALPLLREDFRCYLVSYRRRGRSGDNPDLTPPRLMEDVVAIVESIGEPVTLAAPSGGGMAVLAAAARCEAINGVAVYEPIVFEALGEEEGHALEQAYQRMADTAAEDCLVDAAKDWIAFFANDREWAQLDAIGYFDGAARYVPVLLEEIRQAMNAEGPGPTDPAVLRNIRAPVLLLQGTDSPLALYRDGVRHVAEHVSDTQVQTLDGLGHFGSWVEPAPVVEALRHFANTASPRN